VKPAETLHYLEYLLDRTQAEREGHDWARFSAEQLASAYAPSDAIYYA